MLQVRIDAVEEIISTTSQHLHTLRPILKGLPDLAKGLCRIQYGKVSAYAFTSDSDSAEIKVPVHT